MQHASIYFSRRGAKFVTVYVTLLCNIMMLRQPLQQQCTQAAEQHGPCQASLHIQCTSNVSRTSGYCWQSCLRSVSIHA
jgi:hypothetical protein